MNLPGVGAAFNNSLQSKFDEAFKSAKLKLVADLKEATPVDTGNARDHWVLEGNRIVNTVEYIEDLNRGSSKQAPEFFIEKTVLKNPAIQPKGSIVKYTSGG